MSPGHKIIVYPVVATVPRRAPGIYAVRKTRDVAFSIRPAAAICDDFWREKAPGGYASAEGASSFPRGFLRTLRPTLLAAGTRVKAGA